MNIKAPVYRIVIAQLMVTVIAAVLILPVDVVVAYSVFFGGLTGVIPSAFMAWRMGRESANPGTALKYLVRGELGKLALTALLFSAVFAWVEPLRVAYFFIALVLAMMCNVLVPLIEPAVMKRIEQARSQ